MQAALAMTFRNDPQAKGMSFMRDYGERFDWQKEIFRDWAFTFVSAFMYYYDKDILDRNTLELYKQGLACFEGNAPSYHMELKEHPVIVWDFHSLMMAVKFLFSIKLTDPEQPMKCRSSNTGIRSSAGSLKGSFSNLINIYFHPIFDLGAHFWRRR